MSTQVKFINRFTIDLDSLEIFHGTLTLRKKCPYSELFWSAFSSIRTEYGEIRSISPYSVRMRENADQNNSEYVHFSRSVNIALKPNQNARCRGGFKTLPNNCNKMGHL